MPALLRTLLLAQLAVLPFAQLQIPAALARAQLLAGLCPLPHLQQPLPGQVPCHWAADPAAPQLLQAPAAVQMPASEPLTPLLRVPTRERLLLPAAVQHRAPQWRLTARPYRPRLAAGLH